ncbi:MAG: dephospho-CoA kinase [Abditibacteriota bacterium]|nr:dephospho-CoA kinase [Abditibacteriota bacterium]
MVIGVTGGVGSGKSTVCRILKELGIPVVDADMIGRSALEDSGVVSELVRIFGQDVAPGGKVSRRLLAERAFRDREAQSALNRATHPYIIKKIQDEISHFGRKYDIIALELPLLYECGLSWLCHKVWVVYASEEARLARLEKRGMDREDALRRIRLQMSLEDKARMADFVIDNSLEGYTPREDIVRQIELYRQ